MGKTYKLRPEKFGDYVLYLISEDYQFTVTPALLAGYIAVRVSTDADPPLTEWQATTLS